MRQQFLLVTILISGLFFASCQAKKQPNIIIIVTDDQGWGDVGFHGNTIVKTPRLDAFSKQAVELTNFHVGTTCAPTRAGIMTGRNANRNGAWHTIAGASILNADEQTMPEIFQQAGYRTGMMGKWHLGDSYPYRPHDRGFDEAIYLGGGGVQQTPDYWNNDYFDDTYMRNGIPEKTKGYCTDVWFDELIDFIDQSEDEPFFAYLASNTAHSPFNVPINYREQYESADLKEHQINFYGMLTNLDDNFGRLEDYLKAIDLFDNTILIYTTDNGTAGGISWDKQENKGYGYNPLRGTKGSHYDGGHKVPFLMSWPEGGISGGRKFNNLAAHVDLLPTLSAFANVSFTPKKPMDGSDLSYALSGNMDFPNRMLITDTQRGQWPEKYKNPCVMQGSWRLVNHKELYDTEADPAQKNDLAAQFPERVNAMQDFYESWWDGIIPEWKHSPTFIGAKENPVMITIHDMHPIDKGAIPWNQDYIRQGEINTKGYYKINVTKSGTYQFNLSRWPKESSLTFSDSVAAIAHTKEMEGLSFGKSISMGTAHVKIGNQSIKEEVDNQKTATGLTLTLEEGSYQLETWFDTVEGSFFPAYYTEVTLIN
ncbi:MAG: arylsulfatase [Cyclobacteriaceae bacterium]